MITAVDLKRRIEAQPFKPFRIHMSNGNIYDILNHDAMLIKRNVVEIGTDLDTDSIFERFIQCAILHIVSIEEMASTTVN
jgi:hypothetical protein